MFLLCRAQDVEIASLYTKNCTEYLSCTKCCVVKSKFGKEDPSCTAPGCHEETDVVGAECITTADCEACCAVKFADKNFLDKSCYKPQCFPKLKPSLFSVGETCASTGPDNCKACCKDKFDQNDYHDETCFTLSCFPKVHPKYTIEDGSGAPGSSCMSTGPENCKDCCTQKFKDGIIDVTCKECLLV